MVLHLSPVEGDRAWTRPQPQTPRAQSNMHSVNSENHSRAPNTCLPQQQAARAGSRVRQMRGTRCEGDLGRRQVVVKCSMEYIFVLRNLHCFFKLTPALTGIRSYSQVMEPNQDLNDEINKGEASGL